MSADLLTVIPRKGELVWRHDGEMIRSEGWFHLEGGHVMKRGLGDTRSWRFCSLDKVVEFNPDKVQS